MKVQEYSADAEREILIGMITSEVVAGRIASQWKPGGLFEGKVHNLIGSWVTSHYKQYREVLGSGITTRFKEWAAEQRSKENIEMVEKVLGYLSKEAESRAEEAVNADYLLDLAAKRFTEVHAMKVAEEAISFCKAKQADKADLLLKGYGSSGCNLIGNPGVDLFHDREMITKIFTEEQNEPLIEYEGLLKPFFGHRLARNNLIAFCAPTGFGKSWWLLDMAWRGILARRRVAYFDVGDMTDVQVGERFMIRAANRPRNSDTGEWPFSVNIPISFSFSGHTPLVEFETKTFKSGLNEEKAWAACEDLMYTKVKSKRSYFKMVNIPSRTKSILDVAAILNGWELDNWVPDIVVIDYADILAPINSKADELSQTDETWATMRALSQQLHCLVVTATQANRSAFGKGEMKMEWVGGYARKMTHATALYGVNAKDIWMDYQVTSLNQMKQRSGKKSPMIYVANCLALANPAVLSCYPDRNAENEEEAEETKPSRNGRQSSRRRG